jgi:hypothetical protein
MHFPGNDNKASYGSRLCAFAGQKHPARPNVPMPLGGTADPEEFAKDLLGAGSEKQ